MSRNPSIDTVAVIRKNNATKNYTGIVKYSTAGKAGPPIAKG
jgi:hypothetical protein